jgi:RHS repeat-associated protein
MRHSMTTLRFWGLLVLSMVPFRSGAQSSEVFDQFFRYTETAHKTFIEGIGDDVDPFSGTLHVVQTDLVLPGKAGLDLRLVRSYSSKLWVRTNQADLGSFIGESDPPMLGWGWSFHMGRLKNPNGTGAPTDPCSGDYPVLELPNGSARVFYRVSASNPKNYVSRDRWVMETDCSLLGGGGKGTCVWSTDGVRYEFSSAAADSFQYGGSNTPGWPLSRMVDRFDNQISVTYEPDHLGAISAITDTYGRVITFRYTGTQTDKRLDTVTAGTNVYQYGYTSHSTPITGLTRRFLTSVTPPSGPAFGYAYAVTAPVAQNQYALSSVSYPYGGTISYVYESASFYPGIVPSVPFAVVKSRTQGGKGVAAGTWTYDYVAGSSGMNTTTVTRPDGRGGTTEDVFTLYGFGAVSPGQYWRVGLTERVSRAGGDELEVFDWVASPSVSDSIYSAPGYSICAGSTAPVDTSVYEPLLQGRVVTRGSDSFTTTYSDFDAYGQPRTIDETGPAGYSGSTSRSTTFTYFARPTDGSATINLVKGFPLSRTTCVGSDCVVDGWTYGGPSYAKDTETWSGIKTSFGYHLADPEGRGNLKTVTNALGQSVTLTKYLEGGGTPLNVDFNGAFTFSRTTTWEGWVLTQTDGRNNTTRQEYDGVGRVKRIEPPGSSDVTTIDFDQPVTSGMNVVTTRGPYVLTTTYDGFGRRIATSDSVDVKTSEKYDALGRLWFRSSPYESTAVGEKLDLDRLGRVTTLTKACTGASSPTSACGGDDRSTVTNAYQAQHCVSTTEQRNPDSLMTLRCYASFGDPGEQRLTYLKDAAGGIWKYAYSTAGRLRTVTAPSARGNRTYTYDGTQFQTGEKAVELGTISGDSVSLRYTPNAIGQVKTRKDARGITWTYDYTDPLSRVKGVTYSSGAGDDVSRTYQSGSNNVSTLSSANGGSFSFPTYDALDRLRAQTWTFQGKPYGTTYTYDSAGCLTQIGYPTQSTVTQTCDAANRVKSVTLNGATLISNVVYHPSGEPRVITYPSGRSVTYGYDDRARMKSATTSGFPSPVLGLAYTYDGLDNVATLSNSAVAGFDLRMCASATGTCTDGYDALNRLVTVIAPARWGTVAYDYDSLGNRTLKSVDQPSPFTTTFTYDTSNRLSTATGLERFAPGVYTWDAAGRLASSSDGASYRYDGLGRRALKTEAGQSTVYHYDVAGRLIAETTTTGVSVRDYVYLGSKLVAAEGCLAAGSTPPCSERQWYHTDALGSVLARTDGAGAVVARLEYQPYGEPWNPTAGQGDRQYNGRVYDPGTGFHDYGARMYWPQIGRFVSADTYGGDPSNPASLSRYSYVHNNPYKYVDPTGHYPTQAQVAAQEAAAAAAAAGAGGWGAGTMLVWAGGAGVAGAGGWLAGTWLSDNLLGPYVQNAMDAVLGPPGESASGGSRTEPTLPPRVIATEGDVVIEHYYRSGDHPPAHAHVKGGGETTRIGPNGHPLAGEPELAPAQKRAVEANKPAVRRAVNKIGRWLEHQENAPKADKEKK